MKLAPVGYAFGRRLILGLLLVAIVAFDARPAEVRRVYFGTYTDRSSRGIYTCHMDVQTGKLTAATLAAETSNPSFLALHPSGRFLYAVNEISQFDGRSSGAVSAFAIDSDSGRLTLLNQLSSEGVAPCHLTIDKAGTSVLVANYTGGSVAALSIQPDGRLGRTTAFRQHAGSSVNPRRQKEPHAHSIQLDAANRFAVAADLGTDQLMVYRFNAGEGTLEPHDPPGLAMEPGAGPRQIVFHPGRRHAFVINELSSTLTLLGYDAAQGALRVEHTLSTLPDGPVPGNSTAQVQIHPAGRFVYGSNRGHNSIAVFAANLESGRLSRLENEPTGGKTPRHFAIDPTGTFLLAANQGSDSVVVFRIDAGTGALEPTGDALEVPTPVCVTFLGR